MVSNSLINIGVFTLDCIKLAYILEMDRDGNNGYHVCGST